MIRRIVPCALAMLVFTVSTGVAEENARICSLSRVFECTMNGKCSELSVEEMALPRFVRIDFAKNAIVSLDNRVKRDDTKIAHVQRLEGLTVLQGVEQRGWSILLGQESGNLTLSAAGDGSGFIVFGSCLTP